MDLRTRYTALVTLTTQHVRYISDALRRLEEEEVTVLFSFINAPATLKLTVLLPDSEQKEVEEEKQARVGQVSELLGWVRGLQGRAGGPSTESSLAAQQVASGSFELKATGVCLRRLCSNGSSACFL